MTAVLSTMSLIGLSCSDAKHRTGPADTLATDASAGGRADEGVSPADTDSPTRQPDSTTDPDTTADTGRMPDTSGREAGDDADAGCHSDADGDGLNDCEERQLCTDPRDGDTDGDHLGDREELQKTQTDPCRADTDSDGLEDGTEVSYGLDPNRQSTYGDGVRDADRWFISTCDDPTAVPVDYHEDTTGNWVVALAPSIRNYTELTIKGATGVEAAAVFGNPTREIAGFLLASRVPGSQQSPLELLSGRVDSAIRQLGRVDFDFLGSSFTTHDGKRAATVDYEIRLPAEMSVRQVRRQLLLELAPFDASSVSGLPKPSGRLHRKYRIELSVIQRNHANGLRSHLISLGAAPLDIYRTSSTVPSRLTDLTNTTNITDAGAVHRTRCQLDQPSAAQPKAEFYWVLDQSGSMKAETDIVRQFASTFAQRVQNTRLDYRHGVTNMIPANLGRIVSPPAWHRRTRRFEVQVENRVTNCMSVPRWWACWGEEAGLEAAYHGLTYMDGLSPYVPPSDQKIRSDANVFTIFITDEAPQGNHAMVKPFFRDHPRMYAYAITAEHPRGDCVTGEKPPTGTYKEVALASGGSSADLCSGNLGKTIETIIFDAALASTDVRLDRTPISSSLRVWLNGRWVPRSRSDGFVYSPRHQSLAFFGDYRPTTRSSGKPNRLAIVYETWHRRCKRLPDEADTCPPPG